MKMLFLLFISFLFFAGCSEKVITPNTGEIEFVGFNDMLITALSVNQSEPNYLFVSTKEPPAIFRSVDFGKTWEKVQEGYYSYAILSNFNEVYAGRNRASGSQPKYPLLLKSTDYGYSWVKSDSGIRTFEERVEKIQISEGGNVVFLLLRDRSPDPDANLFYSEDGGKSWMHSSTNPQYYNFQDLYTYDVATDPLNPGKVVVSFLSSNTNYDYVISYDNGKNWVGKEIPNNGILEIVAYNNMVVAKPKTTYSGLLLSTDGGENFIYLRDSILLNLNFAYLNHYDLLITPEQYIILIASKKNDPSKSYIFISKNKGESWQLLVDDADSKSLLAYDPWNKFLYFVKDKENKGLYRLKL